jgi:hypothetical protein
MPLPRKRSLSHGTTVTGSDVMAAAAEAVSSGIADLPVFGPRSPAQLEYTARETAFSVLRNQWMGTHRWSGNNEFGEAYESTYLLYHRQFGQGMLDGLDPLQEISVARFVAAMDTRVYDRARRETPHRMRHQSRLVKALWSLGDLQSKEQRVVVARVLGMASQAMILLACSFVKKEIGMVLTLTGRSQAQQADLQLQMDKGKATVREEIDRRVMRGIYVAADMAGHLETTGRLCRNMQTLIGSFVTAEIGPHLPVLPLVTLRHMGAPTSALCQCLGVQAFAGNHKRKREGGAGDDNDLAPPGWGQRNRHRW